jgi:DDE superfamily endonuclease
VRGCCQDDSRRGLHVPGRRRFTGYGVTPRQGVEPLDEYAWRYAAVEPTTGDACWWAWPRLEAACCTVLLRQLGPQSAERLTILLLDQAPAPGAQRVQRPEHVVRMWLPAYSPACNPVERLWEDRKRRRDGLNGQVRSSLRALQEQVADLVQRYSAETIASLPGYAYVVEAVHALQF